MFGSTFRGRAQRLVWVRVAVPVFGTVCLFLLAAFFLFLPEVKNGLMEQKRQSLRNLSSVALSILESHYVLEKEGVLSPEDARKEAARLIGKLRFGPENKDYFWINDYTPRMIMHPYRSDLDGKSLRSYADASGRKLFVDAVQSTEITGEAFINYEWQWKDDPARVVPKLSFVRRFEPWGWIVGTGVYLDDVEAEASDQALTMGKTGLGILGIALTLALISIWQGRQADVRLHRNRLKLRAIFDQSFQFMALLDERGRVLEINRTALDFYGIQESDVLGAYFWDAPWWKHSPEVQEHLKQSVQRAADGQGICFHTTHVGGAGDLKSVHFSVKPAMDEQGIVFGLIAEGRDMTEQIQAQREKEISLSELEKRNAELERVAYTVSHDLRNPVVTIKGFLGLAEEHLRKSDVQRASLAMQRIDSAAERMDSLLKDLVELFRVGRVDNPPEAVDFADLVRDASADLAQDFAPCHGSVQIGSVMPVAWVDRERFQEVFHNLLTNAARFAAPDRPLQVFVDAEKKDLVWIVSVRDNGIGIRPEYLEKIFQLFQQLSLNGQGTGVGLTLVRRIVEHHGGKIWAESQGEGHGTVFSFTIPVRLTREASHGE